MSSLRGKVALVTGAGRGIGRAHAKALAAAGATVVVNDVGYDLVDGRGGTGFVAGSATPRVAEAVVAEILAAGGSAFADVTDVGDIERAAAMVDRVVQVHRRIDVVVNNAGSWNESTSLDLDNARFDAEFATHVKGTMGTTRAALAAMMEAGVHGRVINTISKVSGEGGMALYAAAKAAIASFTLTAATEMIGHGITVNAISPVALTRQSSNYFFRVGAVDPADTATIDRIGPDQNAALVVFLASEQSQNISGRLIRVSNPQFNADAPTCLSEIFWDSSAGVEARSWTVDQIGTSMAQILRGAPQPIG